MTLDDWKAKLGGGNYVEAAGCRFHYARKGTGPVLLLLHGWPEFWLTWRKNIPTLAEEFDVIVPDLRGFGESRSLDRPVDALLTPDIIAQDLLALLDALNVHQACVAAHDVGAQAAQSMARLAPERLSRMFFFNCPYPGIGKRWAEPESLPETWYQYFNQLPMTPELLRQTPEACRLYIGHILSHWSHDPDVFADDLDFWVEAFLAEGVLEGGFAWYRGVDFSRRETVRLDMAGNWPPKDLVPISPPTRVFWGEHDPVLRAEWSDRLDEFFFDVQIGIAPSAGHFVHYETPDAANREMLDFFRRAN